MMRYCIPCIVSFHFHTRCGHFITNAIITDAPFTSVKILVELSREHPTLPVAEIRRCLNAHGAQAEELYHNGVFVAAVAGHIDWKKIAERLAMSFSINEVVGTDMEEFLHHIHLKGSFRVEGGTGELRRTLGRHIAEKTGAPVNLESPDTIIRVFPGHTTYFCRELATVDRGQFETRRSSLRPFSVPTTLHPRMARVMVNLSGVREGETLLDPFCGAGGILIEGGLVGAQVAGIEVKRELLSGCKQNLQHFHIQEYALHHGDMRHVPFPEADVVVTDFPYGRASHLSDVRDTLYPEALEKIAACGVRTVIGMPSLEFRTIIRQYFDIEEIHCARVHRSLMRFFYVLRP